MTKRNAYRLMLTVITNYKHIQEVNDLESILPEPYKLIMQTTRNSIYDYKLLTFDHYKNKQNHLINKLAEEFEPEHHIFNSDQYQKLWKRFHKEQIGAKG